MPEAGLDTGSFESAHRTLAVAGIENPRREATLLARLARDPAHFAALLARRAAREPMALLRGTQGFWTLDLAVSRATLIPRPDSETVVEAALVAHPDPRSILDLGTGTGALLLAVLAERPAALGLGIDIDPAACHLAAGNARAYGLADRAGFVAADWAECVAGRFDLVLCNPPYIPTGDIVGLMPEVAVYEPARALDGGVDGLDAYRDLAVILGGLLTPGGRAVLELGVGQSADVRALLAGAGLATVDVRADLAGVPRALTAAA